MRPVLALLVAGVIAGLAAVPAPAKSAYCTTYAKKHKLTKRFSDSTVLLLSPAKNRSSFTVCSNKTKKRFVFDGVGSGDSVEDVAAVDGKCIALLVDPSDQTLPELATLDPRKASRGALNQYGGLTLGDGSAKAKVSSLQIASNCAVTVGLTLTDSAGAVTRQILTQFVGSGGGFRTIAAGPAMTDAELKKIKATASGTGVNVSWTEGGAPKTQALAP